VIQALRERLDVSKDKGVILGQSFGGALSIAAASKNPTGIQATINFAGGGGGNPETQPGNPCSAYQLERMFGSYGKTSKIPTLWVYTENNMWMGEKHPKDWFAAFKANGGNGDFLALPANGVDGHGVFTRDPKAWRPQVEQFLRSTGLIE
jgi:dienelactone hydrolase